MTRTVTFDFVPGERVTIDAIKERAIVMQSCVTITGATDYQVAYWWNGEYKTVWLPASQLSEVDR